MWPCASRSNEFIADLPRKGQIRKGPMQMSELAPAQAEFNAAEAMVVRRYAFPPLNGLTYHLYGCLLGHFTSHAAAPYPRKTSPRMSPSGTPALSRVR